MLANLNAWATLSNELKCYSWQIDTLSISRWFSTEITRRLETTCMHGKLQHGKPISTCGLRVHIHVAMSTFLWRGSMVFALVHWTHTHTHTHTHAHTPGQMLKESEQTRTEISSGQISSSPQLLDKLAPQDWSFNSHHKIDVFTPVCHVSSFSNIRFDSPHRSLHHFIMNISNKFTSHSLFLPPRKNSGIENSVS